MASIYDLPPPPKYDLPPSPMELHVEELDVLPEEPQYQLPAPPPRPEPLPMAPALHLPPAPPTTPPQFTLTLRERAQLFRSRVRVEYYSWKELRMPSDTFVRTGQEALFVTFIALGPNTTPSWALPALMHQALAMGEKKLKRIAPTYSAAQGVAYLYTLGGVTTVESALGVPHSMVTLQWVVLTQPAVMRKVIPHIKLGFLNDGVRHIVSSLGAKLKSGGKTLAKSVVRAAFEDYMSNDSMLSIPHELLYNKASIHSILSKAEFGVRSYLSAFDDQTRRAPEFIQSGLDQGNELLQNILILKDQITRGEAPNIATLGNTLHTLWKKYADLRRVGIGHMGDPLSSLSLGRSSNSSFDELTGASSISKLVGRASFFHGLPFPLNVAAIMADYQPTSMAEAALGTIVSITAIHVKLPFVTVINRLACFSIPQEVHQEYLFSREDDVYNAVHTPQKKIQAFIGARKQELLNRGWNQSSVDHIAQVSLEVGTRAILYSANGPAFATFFSSHASQAAADLALKCNFATPSSAHLSKYSAVEALPYDIATTAVVTFGYFATSSTVVKIASCVIGATLTMNDVKGKIVQSRTYQQHVSGPLIERIPGATTLRRLNTFTVEYRRLEGLLPRSLQVVNTWLPRVTKTALTFKAVHEVHKFAQRNGVYSHVRSIKERTVHVLASSVSTMIKGIKTGGALDVTNEMFNPYVALTLVSLERMKKDLPGGLASLGMGALLTSREAFKGVLTSPAISLSSVGAVAITATAVGAMKYYGVPQPVKDGAEKCYKVLGKGATSLGLEEEVGVVAALATVGLVAIYFGVPSAINNLWVLPEKDAGYHNYPIGMAMSTTYAVVSTINQSDKMKRVKARCITCTRRKTRRATALCARRVRRGIGLGARAAQAVQGLFQGVLNRFPSYNLLGL